MRAGTSGRAGGGLLTTPDPTIENLASRYLGKSWRNILLAVFALGYAVYFVRMMLRGLRSWFSGDDLLNIHYAWSRPLGDLIRANILFFNHYSRPMGELLLYGLYSAFGLNPGPFNVVRLVICIVNVVVLYVFAAQLARSREVGVLTVMLVGFNAQLFSVYYDSGMFFDALAFLFFWFRYRSLLLLSPRGTDAQSCPVPPVVLSISPLRLLSRDPPGSASR